MFWRIILIITGQVILLTAYFNYFTYPELVSTLKGADWILLLALVPLALLGVTLRSVRRCIVLRPIYHFKPSELAAETVIAVRKKLHHPQGYLIGYLSQVLQKKSGVPESVSIPYLMLDRFFDILAGIVLSVVVVWHIPLKSMGFKISLVISLSMLAVIFLVVFVLIHFFRQRKRLEIQESICLRASAPAFMAFVKKSSQIVSNPVGRRKQDIPLAIVHTLLAIFTDMIMLFLAARAVSLAAPYSVLIMYYVLLLNLGMLPGFPGFPGLADFLSVWFLQMLGLSSSLSAASILILHSAYVLGILWVAAFAGVVVGISRQRNEIFLSVEPGSVKVQYSKIHGSGRYKGNFSLGKNSLQGYFELFRKKGDKKEKELPVSR